MARNVVVIIDKPALTRFLGWTGEVGRSFERLAKESKFRVAGVAPKRFGGLSRSISYNKGRLPTGLYFDVGSNRPYAAAQSEGGRPHVIRARRAPQLRFFWKKVGRVVYFSRVNHPGNPATHFIEDGVGRALRMWERGG